MWLAACGGKDTPKPDAAATGSQAYEQGGANVPPPAAAAGTPAAGGKRTLLILGTSLTAGLGLDPKDAYPALLEAKADSAGLAWTVVNAGLSGETSAGALRRADWVLSGPGDVVVVETGANDGLRGVEVDSTRANIRALLARVKAAKPGVPVLLVQMEAPPNMGQRYTRQFHDMYAALAKEAEVPLLPFLLDGVAGVAKYNQADGIHPNEDGSKLVAANLWKALETVLRK
jgi:acyl-CoA thioesterase-1